MLAELGNTHIKLDQSRVIVVDDDVDFAEAEAEFLEAQGFEVRVAHDIDSAVQIAVSFDAQIALIDLRLGHASGIDLIDALRISSPDLICVMMTGHGGMESAIEALRRGANDYLRKPVDPRELLLVLNRCIEGQYLKEQKIEADIARQKAEVANNARAEFLASMSHELRTPMNAILGFAQMLQIEGKNLEARQQAWVSNIKTAGDSLLLLINELLDTAKIDAGKVELEIMNVPVLQCLQQALMLTQEMASNRGIKISDISFTDLKVSADIQRLNQVLINLISNAIKYNREGGEVSIEVSLASGSRVRVSICDTGPGITEENLQNIFEPFFRVKTGDTSTEGTGIGLSITRQLIKRMDGQIGVYSKVGSGTTFWIELPQAKQEDHKEISGVKN